MCVLFTGGVGTAGAAGGGGGGLESPSEGQAVGSALPQLNAQEVVDALGKWEGMEDTISLFADLVKENSMLH